MKKYLMGIVAVVLAISFSAFTGNRKAGLAKQTDDYMFWYYYNPSTDELEGEISLSEITHQDAKDATECPDNIVSTVECARGYEIQQSDPYEEDPLAGDDQVKMPEQ